MPNDKRTNRRAFVSYARSDAAIAKLVANLLTAGGVTVWMDTEISAGQDWVHTIERQVKSHDIFVVLLSEGYSKSEWCNYELASAVSASRAGQIRIVPIRLDDTPLPKLLLSTGYVDARDNIQAASSNVLKAIESAAA